MDEIDFRLSISIASQYDYFLRYRYGLSILSYRCVPVHSKVPTVTLNARRKTNRAGELKLVGNAIYGRWGIR